MVRQAHHERERADYPERAARPEPVEGSKGINQRLKNMTFHVYILKCSDNSYYTGHTDNLEQRLSQHQQRYFRTCYTATRLPVELLYCQEFPAREEALASERQIKGWSRKKKEAMMRGDWNEVSRLAQNTLRQAQGDRNNTVHALRQAQDGRDMNQDNRNSSVHPELVEGKPVEAQNSRNNNKNNGEA